jgi:hypothetical protein
VRAILLVGSKYWVNVPAARVVPLRWRLRRSHPVPRPTRQPIQGDGCGPGLLSGAKRLTSERLEVLRKASFGDLLQG